MNLVFSTFVVAVVISIGEGAGPCYTFSNNSYIKYEDGLDIANSTHFKLVFKTGQGRGLIYFAEGNYIINIPNDYEGLFLKRGKLTYFLFNPTEYGTGSTFGFFAQSAVRVDDNRWHTVEFFRNKKVMKEDDDGIEKMVYQTGLKLDDEEVFVDDRFRADIKIKEPIWLGNFPQFDRLVSNYSHVFVRITLGNCAGSRHVKAPRLFTSRVRSTPGVGLLVGVLAMTCE
ncbi:hypothetical protein ScPMuIL_016551 [Solemya velum]